MNGFGKLIVLWLLVMGLFISGMVFGRLTLDSPSPIPHQVTAKNEVAGRCYVQTWVEVTPEEYIGLDVGDEFEVTK